MSEQDWHKQYKKLKPLVAKEGANAFHHLSKAKGPLGKWYKAQQTAFKKNTLTSSQLKLLLSVNFPLPLEISEFEKTKQSWTSRKKSLFAAWLWQFENLRKYLSLNPGAFPKGTLHFPKGNNLGRWINLQSEKFVVGKLKPERIQLLKSISFPFRGIKPREEGWQKQYQALSQYRRVHPNKWPSQTEEYPKGNRLGRWLFFQREMWAKDKLPAKRVQLLLALGIPKEIRRSSWMLKYRQLEDFVRTHSNRFPLLDEEYPVGNKLGRWAQKQRQFFRIGWLSQEKRKLLNRLGFSWKVQSDNWQTQIRFLRTFLNDFGRFPHTDEKYPSGNALGRWVARQRELKRSGQLAKASREKLEKMGIAWDPREIEWMNRFNELRLFIKKHSRMPNRSDHFSKKMNLSSWVRSLKDSYTRGTLSRKRKKLLDQIGFIWDAKVGG